MPLTLVDLRRLEDLYETQHGGRYRQDPELSAALDLVDSAPSLINECRALRRIGFAAGRVSNILAARGVSFPALDDLNAALAEVQGVGS
jgi:hypothetical protein